MIFFKKEKEVVELIEQHVEEMEQCLSVALKTLQAYMENRINEAKRLARETDNIESRADKIRHEIRDKLYSGAYMPLFREDIYKLVESLDSVTNAAEKCCDLFLNQRPHIPEALIPDMQKITRTALGVGKPLKHAVLCYLRGVCPVEETRHHAKDIGVIETNVDKLEWDLTKKIFSSELEYSHKLHLRLCMDVVVAISDRAEDSADQLELVTLKAMM